MKVVKKANKSPLLAVLVVHHPGIGMMPNAGKSTPSKSTPVNDETARRKSDCKLTDDLLKQHKEKMSYVLDQPGKGKDKCTVMETYGASLDIWFLLDKDRKVAAIGNGHESLEKALRKA